MPTNFDIASIIIAVAFAVVLIAPAAAALYVVVYDTESAPLQTRPAASAYLDRVRLFSHHPGPTLLTITAEWDDADVAEWQAQDALERKADIEFPGWVKRRMVDDSTFGLRRLVVEFEPGRPE